MGGVNLLMLFSKLPKKRSGKCIFYEFLHCLFMLVFCQVITHTIYEKCSIKCKAVYREAVFVGGAGDSEHEFSVNMNTDK